MFFPPRPQTDMIRLKYDASRKGQMYLASYDPNTRLTGSVSDGGDGVGIRMALTGGLAGLSDPLDGPYITWDLKDAFGISADPAKNWTAEFLIVERTPPGLSSDTCIWIGIANERQNSATIDAHWGGIVYTAANRNIRVGGLVNGTVGSISNSGTNANIRQAFISGARYNDTRLNSTVGQAFTSSGTNLNVSVNNGSSAGGFTFLATGTPTIIAGAFRTAATAGDETVEFDLYVRPFLQSSSYQT